MKSTEEIINHYGAVRMRVTGAGNLRMRLLSLSETRQFPLFPFTMLSTTDIQPTRLANFTQQRAQLKIGTNQIDEVFEISKIVIFVKPVASSYPNG